MMRRAPWMLLLGVVTVVGFRSWTSPTGDAGLDASRLARRVAPGARLEAVATTRGALAETIADARARLDADARDREAVVRLADALLRQARVTGNPGLADEAERRLRAARGSGSDIELERMLLTVMLSRHEFEAVVAPARSMAAVRPADAWIRGVLGDALLELGRYEEAFDAYEAMMAVRPGAAAYGRAAHARELQGDLQGALTLMRMAADSTSPRDAESMAWHQAQIGELLIRLGRLPEARLAFGRARAFFPEHPTAVDGTVRALAAAGDREGALALGLASFARTPRASLAAMLGDLLLALERPDDAERYYRLAESAWRMEQPEPAELVEFLVARDRDVARAVELADAEVGRRDDVRTLGAAAWARFKSGRLAGARELSRRALRTGSVDKVLLLRAAAIERATGDTTAAGRLLERAAGIHSADLVAVADALRHGEAPLDDAAHADPSAGAVRPAP